jgi:hypothetical protein
LIAFIWWETEAVLGADEVGVCAAAKLRLSANAEQTSGFMVLSGNNITGKLIEDAH